MIFTKRRHKDPIDPEQITHLPDVEEVIGNIPGSVLRNALTCIFLILVSLIVGAWLFKMPEVVSGKILLTTSNAPTPLVSKVSGRIASLYAKDGEEIGEDQLIAVLESSTDFEHLIALEHTLDSLTGNWVPEVQKLRLPENVMLGDLQNSYFIFYRLYANFHFFVTDKSIQDKLLLHRKMFRLKKEEVAELERQNDIRHNRFSISHKIFKRDSILFVQGVESSKVYDLAFQNFLIEKENYMNFFNTIRTLQANILQIEQTIQELESSQSEKNIAMQNDLVEKLHVLKSQIRIFKEKYFVIAPTAGILTFTKYWSENQFVMQGERIATLVPKNPIQIKGRLTLSAAAIGKVEVGHKVNIKLAGFPYMRYGIIEGIVSSISLVPGEDGYIAEVQLKYGMTSKYEDELRFVHEMDGLAEILVEDTRLLERLLNPLRSFFVNNN